MTDYSHYNRYDPDKDPDNEMWECRCGKRFRKCEGERVYDDQRIYAGLWCSYECADMHMNLHMTLQDYAEAGETVEPEDY